MPVELRIKVWKEAIIALPPRAIDIFVVGVAPEKRGRQLNAWKDNFDGLLPRNLQSSNPDIALIPEDVCTQLDRVCVSRLPLPPLFSVCHDIYDLSIVKHVTRVETVVPGRGLEPLSWNIYTT